MDGKDEKHNGYLQTVYEDDEESSTELPTVEATPGANHGPGPYQDNDNNNGYFYRVAS